MRSLIWFLFSIVFMWTSGAYSGSPSKIITGENPVTIYSGPGRNFRIIRTVNQAGELQASTRIVQGRDGDYYKVLIRFKNGNRQIGYIDTDSAVKFERGDESGEDIDRISTLHLAKSSMQVAFHMLKNSRMYWTLGYVNYLLPNFYVRPFGGQILTDLAGSLIVGIGLGTDHLFTDSASFFTEVGGGMVAAPKSDVIFKGSESANAMLDAMAGIRFNAELASVSFGLGQMAIFNANNSYLGWNVGFTLEVGL